MGTNYWDDIFLKYLSIEDIKIVFEVGARYGDESIVLSNIFKNSKIFSFECNPLTIDICSNKFKGNKNIKFFSHGLGEKSDKLPFYSYIENNDGASSFLKRDDFIKTQKETGIVEIRTLSDFVLEKKIKKIDLLCMDVQGYELNILKGAKDFLKKIKFIIMEEPNPVINIQILNKDQYSKYVNAPGPEEIKKFMRENNFVEIERVEENFIEHNVMYKNLN